MDIRLYASVLWRFKWLVVLGFLLATALSVLSFAHVSKDGIGYRDSQLWSSKTRLGVTQKGFPWGRLLASESANDAKVPTNSRTGTEFPLADPNRLNTLAVLYAELATSDPVRAQIERMGAIRLCARDGEATGRQVTSARCGRVVATPVVAGQSQIMLPLIDLTAITTSPGSAVALAQQSSEAFSKYMRDQQEANQVPVSDRVIVQQLVRPQAAEIYQGRSKTMPIVVFLGVMFAIVGLSFLLENLRPRPLGALTPDSAVRDGVQGEIPGEARRTA